MDYNKKLLKYGTEGVREYWIVDPTKQFIMVYNFEQNTFAIDFAGINIE